MNREIQKIDGNFDREVIVFNSRHEFNEYRRSHPWPIPSTHKYEYRYVEPTEDELRKTPAALPKLIRGPVALGITDISARTDNFNKLTMMELRWLCDTYGLKPRGPDEIEKGDKPNDRDELLLALRKHMNEDSSETAVPSEPAPVRQEATDKENTIIPPDLAEANHGQLEDIAANLGCVEGLRKLKFKPLIERRLFIARARLRKNSQLPQNSSAPEKITAVQVNYPAPSSVSE